ncbi:MAG: FliM/FliN family flagellar motor switch protein, partial [Terriglobales bacterium]
MAAAAPPMPASAPVAPAAVPAGAPIPAPDGELPSVERWDQLIWLPCHLGVELSVPRMTVGDILRLQMDSVVETRWQQNADVPIRANGQL